MDVITLLAQVVGGIGVALLIAAFQVNSRSVILKIQIANCLVWALYYLLVGAFTGAGMVAIAAIRCWAFERYRQHEWLLQFFILFYAVTTLLTWEGITSILPLIGIILASVAMWQKDPQSIRLISLTPTAFWLPYNFTSGSYMGMIGDVVTFSSATIGIIRFDLLPRLRHRQQAIKFEETDDESVIIAM